MINLYFSDLLQDEFDPFTDEEEFEVISARIQDIFSVLLSLCDKFLVS